MGGCHGGRRAAGGRAKSHGEPVGRGGWDRVGGHGEAVAMVPRGRPGGRGSAGQERGPGRERGAGGRGGGSHGGQWDGAGAAGDRGGRTGGLFPQKDSIYNKWMHTHQPLQLYMHVQKEDKLKPLKPSVHQCMKVG